MEKPPADFDLKLMPDWLKEAPAKNPYANYEVREERPRRDFGERPNRPREDRRPKSRDEKRGQNRDRGRDAKPPQHSFSQPREEIRHAPIEQQPAAVKVEFLPEPVFVESIARQVRGTNRAYPLFELARMFLEKPERHRVRLSGLEPNKTLFQLGENGPVALDAAILERTAFETLKAEFYAEEKTLREPLKGNFSNVARCRLTGTLLGPTSYHGYQPALRKLYEERFSRRMPFAEFQREIEIVSDPAAVEAWKEEARAVTTYKTLKEAEPVAFESSTEAEQHFRKNYLGGLIRTGASFDIAGETSRQLEDRRIASAVRQAWEAERHFPAQLMFHLRTRLGRAGLQLFKHRKRAQFVTAIRPAPFKDKSFSPNIAEILRVIESTSKCSRAELARTILGEKETDPELPKLEAALASDLHWLIDAGRVIEFHDGRLDLPFMLVDSKPSPTPNMAPEPATPTSAAKSSSESAGP